MIWSTTSSVIFIFNEIYKSLQTSCLPYKYFPQDYLKIKKEISNEQSVKKKKKQANKQRDKLSVLQEANHSQYALFHGLYPLPLLGQFSKGYLEILGLEESTCPFLLLILSFQAHELPLFSTTIYEVSKLHRPFTFSSSPLFLSSPALGWDPQSILLINADSWLSQFVPFSCWEYHFRIQLIWGNMFCLSPCACPAPPSDKRPAKINLRWWQNGQEFKDNGSPKADLLKNLREWNTARARRLIILLFNPNAPIPIFKDRSNGN